MRWEKLGRVFVADRHHDWMQTHAAWPRALHLRDDVFRVFFSTRDAANRSHIAFLDMDVTGADPVLSVSPQPVLSPGPNGGFDESGVIPCDVVRLGERLALYYAGFSAASEVFCGLAYLDDEMRRATRASPAPLLSRSDAEPFSGGAVCVRPLAGTAGFHMWYESCVGWSAEPSGRVPRFAIKHAVSPDGIQWNRLDEVCIGGSAGGSYVSNPSVLMDGKTFKMWYSHKASGRYRIGYAQSKDGGAWTPDDEPAGITVSTEGWDSEDIEYPFVFPHRRDLYMLYNGNQYGRTGFGLARLARD